LARVPADVWASLSPGRPAAGAAEVLRTMGLMRLSLQDRGRIPPKGLDHVYICGSDELPWCGRAYFSGNQLIVERAEDDSGSVHVPWRIDDRGDILIATSTLMERDRPYMLEVELARGTTNRLRSQMAQWEMLGLNVPDSLRNEAQEATRLFARAATSQADPARAADWAQRALVATYDAMNHLVDTYSQQALEMRHVQSQPLPTLLGIQLGTTVPKAPVARALPSAFNLFSLPLNWKRIETSEGHRDWEKPDAQLAWAQSSGSRVSGGPLLELDDRGVPDWAYLWEGDFDSLLSFMLDHVRAVVKRYRGKVQLWQIAARITHGRVLGLSEEQRLQVAVRAINAVRELDPQTPMIVTFDQPWAEYLATERLDLAPLHFADALVRADLGLSGLGLEINVGYHPGATLHRSPLAYSRLIDIWSLLELPLFVALTVPSSAADDPQANRGINVFHGERSKVSPATQAAWIERHVPLLLAKNCVQVILWNQLSDAAPHEYPHGGLFDALDKPKPALEVLRKIRKDYLV
jgi:Glycosyl hydrolase family 10